MLDANDLTIFEEEIASLYEDGRISAPVHLRNGNEEILVNLFNNLKISKEDYVYSTWASHLHALLKEIPQERVKKDILKGRSITLHYPDYNFYSSGIVGGNAPIATGTALALKKQNKPNRVYCFMGDMSFRAGISHESIMYSLSQNLPITFIVEDNGKSVGTPTEECWGQIPTEHLYGVYKEFAGASIADIVYYKYEMSYPHSGTGVFVEF